MMVKFKDLTIIVLCIFLIAAAGCGKSRSNIPVSGGDVPQQIVTETPPISPVQEEVEELGISDSNNIKGWKTLKAAVLLQQLSDDGTSSTSLPDDIPDKDKLLKYSIDFPGDWSLESSVFYDSKKNKVAEIAPAILLKQGQESVFLDYKPMADFGEELVSKETKQLNSYKVAKVITKMPTELGNWYPYMYYISDGTRGFRIFLYSKDLNKEDQELFDKIVNTFVFKK